VLSWLRRPEMNLLDMQADPYLPQSRSHQAAPMRIAWVTPDYPPDRGGVSDHSSAMVDVLRSAGHDVLVCSRPHERGFDRLNAELAAHGPALVVVAYTPLGYAPRSGGVAPAFTHWCMGLRRRLRCKAILLAHEACLPTFDLWRERKLKLAALGAVQAAQFSALTVCFDSVLFSNLRNQRLWARHLPSLANRFHTIRICSNIPYTASAHPGADLSAAGSPVPKPTILFFGSGHDSVLFDYVEEAFVELLKVERNAGLVIVGMSPEKLRQRRPSLANLGARVHALGYVPAPQVSLWLQFATLVLAPLAEGVGARKGTVMAALQHGQAVITTKGHHTLEDIAWNEVCMMAPLDRKVFAATAVEAFNDPDLRTEIGRAARTEYDAHASASVTALGILDYAEHLGEPNRHA